MARCVATALIALSLGCTSDGEGLPKPVGAVNLSFDEGSSGAAPTGWELWKAPPHEVEIARDETVKRAGSASVRLRRIADGPSPQALARQCIEPGRLVGHRVQLSGWLRTADVDASTHDDGANLWLAVANEFGDTLGYGTSSVGGPDGARPTTATDWTRATAYVDVAEEATRLCFGLQLLGSATVWADDLVLRAVAETEPTDLADSLVNLSFEVIDDSGFPSGWEHTSELTERVTDTGHDGDASVRITDEGVLSQCVDATPYRGDRLVASAYVKAQVSDGPFEGDIQVSSWADGDRYRSVALSRVVDEETNTDERRPERAVRTTIDWTRVEVGVDVHDDATEVCLSAYVHGTGTLWVDDFDMWTE